MRIIAHVDMDAFFAAIEQRDNPSLVGRPVIIGGRRDTPRGVVSTCSYEARRFGVHSAMPLVQAVRLCPQGIFLPGNHAKYGMVSRQLHRILLRFSPLVEQVSIDEAYLDLSNIAECPEGLADFGVRLKQAIRDELSLTASVGIGECKFVAKLGSDLRKPDGLAVILADDFDRIILPLPLGRIHGVGEKTAAKLRGLGLATIGDVRRLPESTLVSLCGKYGHTLYQLCRGIDPRPVQTEYEAKSIGRETTFPSDVSDKDEIRSVIQSLSASVAARLAAEGVWGKTVTLKIRFPDFTTWTRSKTVDSPFADAEDIEGLAAALLEKVYSEKGGRELAFRLLGVSVSQFSPFHQLNLFVAGKERKVDEILSQVTSKCGPGSVRLASDQKSAGKERPGRRRR